MVRWVSVLGLGFQGASIMNDQELGGLEDGTLVYDSERNLYGVVTHEFIEEQSDWIRVVWETGKAESLPFCYCEDIFRVPKEVRTMICGNALIEEELLRSYEWTEADKVFLKACGIAVEEDKL
jgi:hypothetical protein